MMHWFHGLTRMQISFLILEVLLMVTAEENKLEPSEQDGPSHDVDKRYIAALAKSGRLPKFVVSQKRVQEYGEDNSNSENPQDNLISELSDAWQNEKRHVGSFLKAHGKPSLFKPRSNRDAASETSEESIESGLDKRNVATLAKLGRLNAIRYASFAPKYGSGNKRVFYYDTPQSDANTVAEEESPDCDEEEDGNEEEGDNNDLDNHIGPNWTQQKRYIAALARSGRLPVWHTQRSYWGGKRDRPTPYWMTYRSGARAYGNKRLTTSGNNQYGTKNKRCKRSQDIFVEDKRNLAMLARKGMLPYRPYVSA